MQSKSTKFRFRNFFFLSSNSCNTSSNCITLRICFYYTNRSTSSDLKFICTIPCSPFQNRTSYFRNSIRLFIMIRITFSDFRTYRNLGKSNFSTSNRSNSQSIQIICLINYYNHTSFNSLTFFICFYDTDRSTVFCSELFRTIPYIPIRYIFTGLRIFIGKFIEVRISFFQFFINRNDELTICRTIFCRKDNTLRTKRIISLQILMINSGNNRFDFLVPVIDTSMLHTFQYSKSTSTNVVAIRYNKKHLVYTSLIILT